MFSRFTENSLINFNQHHIAFAQSSVFGMINR